MAELNATCGAESDTQSVVSESQQSLASTDVTTPLSPGEHEPISGDSSQGGYEIPTRLRTLHNLVIQVYSQMFICFTRKYNPTVGNFLGIERKKSFSISVGFTIVTIVHM